MPTNDQWACPAHSLVSSSKTKLVQFSLVTLLCRSPKTHSRANNINYWKMIDFCTRRKSTWYRQRQRGY